MYFQPLVGKTFGAVVTGKRIVDFDDNDWIIVHQAFLDRGVLIFPGQFATAPVHEMFALKFGHIEKLAGSKLKAVPIGNMTGKALFNGINAGKSHSELYESAHVVTDAADLERATQNEAWHIDSTYMAIAAKAGTLNAIEVPSVGGETAFADAAAAYDVLDDAARQSIDGLQAYHSLHYSLMYKQGRESEVGKAYGYNGDSWLHSLVKVHPETGRKSIYAGRHAFRIKGMGRTESSELIGKLNDFVVAEPSRVYFHAWRPGDLAIWDNRRMYHRAGEFDVRSPRLLLGIRIAGDESEACCDAPESKDILDEELRVLRRDHNLPPVAKL